MNMDKLNEFKKLFFTNKTRSEIKRILCLTQKEYQILFNQTKKEFELPKNYRRQPQRYGLYIQDSYYLYETKEEDDDVEIKTYIPSFPAAKYVAENTYQNKVLIEKATEDNIKKLIYDEFFIKKNNWEMIMMKLKLTYQVFYKLLNDVKQSTSVDFNKTNRDDRYIYKYNEKTYYIRKFVNGKYKNFGYYHDKEIAIKIRNYLENINWNIELFNQTKEDIINA